MFWQTEARRLGGCPGRSLAAALVVTLLMSGCSSESGNSDNRADDQPSASQATKSQPDTSRKTAGNEPKPSAPTLPAEAKGDSVNAAEAFVEHYIDLFNYAMTTGDTKAFRAASRGCEGCDNYAALFEKVERAGGSAKSRGWIIQEMSIFPQGRNATVLLNVDSSRILSIPKPRARPTVIPPDSHSLLLVITQEPMGWVAQELTQS